jgi:hypothetical protein
LVFRSFTKTLLQSYIWQNYDLFPEFPELRRFLAFWQEEARGPTAFCARCALQTDQAGGDQSNRRGIPAALGRQFGDARRLGAPMASWASPASTAARKSPFLL